MKIGIYGGTFDPPHIGHINACKAFLEQIELDKLYVIPVYTPPHKNVSSKTMPYQRFDMTKLAFEPLSDKIIVSDIEIKREGKSYTADTIRAFKDELDNPEIYFLCGTDMILTMDFWYNPAYIFENAIIVYVRRENDHEITDKIAKKCCFYKEKFGAKIIHIDLNAIELSSSEIRQNSSKNDEALLPEILRYIEENGLYKEL